MGLKPRGAYVADVHVDAPLLAGNLPPSPVAPSLVAPSPVAPSSSACGDCGEIRHAAYSGIAERQTRIGERGATLVSAVAKRAAERKSRDSDTRSHVVPRHQ